MLLLLFFIRVENFCFVIFNLVSFLLSHFKNSDLLSRERGQADFGSIATNLAAFMNCVSFLQEADGLKFELLMFALTCSYVQPGCRYCLSATQLEHQSVVL